MMKRIKKFFRQLSVDLHFLVPVTVIVFFLCLIIIIVKDKMVSDVESSLNRYMGYLKDTVFLSTYDSLKKGNMKVFEDILTQIGTYEQVKEFSLINKNGKVVYSTNKKLLKTKDSKAAEISKPLTEAGRDKITYYFPVVTVDYCTRCHRQWESGEINSVYRISLSNSSFVNLVSISSFSDKAIFIGGFIAVLLIYILYSYIKQLRFSDIISESEKRYRSLFENIMDVQFCINENGELILISPSGVNLLNYRDKNEILHKNFGSKLLYDEQTYQDLVKKIYSEKEVYGYEMILKKKNGDPLIAEANMRLVEKGGEKVIEGIFRDVTERKNNEKQLQLLASVFENTIESIMIVSSDGKIQKVNQAFLDSTGYSEEEIVDFSSLEIQPFNENRRYLLKVAAEVRKNDRWNGEIWCRRKSGEIFPQWMSVSVLKDDNGNVMNYIVLMHDITSLKKSEEELRYQATHDMLTGLPNRQLFEDRLKRAVAHHERYGGKFALLFIDLDNFKNINDTLGHKIGDLLLIKAAETLLECCRESDTVARLGGDEFTIILNDVEDENGIVTVTERILKSVSSAKKVGGHVVYTSASIGIAVYPADGRDSVSLIKNADMAMYKAKELGANDYYFYKSDLKVRLERKISLTTKLARALEENDIKVYFQPLIDLKSGKITGAEALARWQMYTSRFIHPDEFIEAAEESGQISTLGNFVLNKSCENLRKWHDAGFENLIISVNLSVKQMNDQNLVTKTRNALNKYSLSPTDLVYEITENVAMKDFGATLALFKELSGLGVKISMDDFGTGYSSLAYLKQFPLNSIKIDKVFLQNIPDNEKDNNLIKGIIWMAKSLGLSVVAEGVENKFQSEFLREIGCDGCQGYYYSRPLPEDEFFDYLETVMRDG